MTKKTAEIEWTDYLACGKIEGFEEIECHELEAWAHLIKTGSVWKLQGFYGRSATDLIKNGVISKEGVVDWEKVL